MRIFVFVLLFSFLSLAPVAVLAATILDGPIVPKCGGTFEGDCDVCDVMQLVRNLINFAISFAAIVATLMFVYAGFLYFTASAKQDNIKKAHGIFWKVFLGFVFILAAWLIVDVVMKTMLGGGNFGPWNQLPC